MKTIGLEGRARRLSQARCNSDASAQQHRRCLRWRHGFEPRWGCHRQAPGRCRFSAADLGFRRLGRPSGGVWLLPRRRAGDVAWRRELCPICAHAWATAFRRRSCQRVGGHRKAPVSAASPNLVRELGRGPSHLLVDAVHGAYFVDDVSRQSRHTRVITQVIGASSLGPVIRTADRQNSIVTTCRLLVGRLGLMPGKDTESNPSSRDGGGAPWSNRAVAVGCKPCGRLDPAKGWRLATGSQRRQCIDSEALTPASVRAQPLGRVGPERSVGSAPAARLPVGRRERPDQLHRSSDTPVERAGYHVTGGGSS
jgi:hypothetical protein